MNGTGKMFVNESQIKHGIWADGKLVRWVSPEEMMETPKQEGLGDVTGGEPKDPMAKFKLASKKIRQASFKIRKSMVHVAPPTDLNSALNN